MRQALLQDQDLPVCNTCGCQMAEKPANGAPCPICIDDRQWVPEGGSVWISLRQMWDEGRKINWIQDKDDDNIFFLRSEPHTGIGQTPLIMRTNSGIIMIECCSFVDEASIGRIEQLVAESGKPFLGIAISHPHWYNSSMTWSRALGNCPIYAHALDKEWWFRPDSVSQVTWFDSPTLKIGDHVTMILCGGHFPGACVTYVDRGAEKGGFLATADIIMISQGSSFRRQVAFMYSYPNFLPLAPQEVTLIWNRIKPFPFTDAYGPWPDRRLVGGAKQTIFEGVQKFITKEGYDVAKFDIALDS